MTAEYHAVSPWQTAATREDINGHGSFRIGRNVNSYCIRPGSSYAIVNYTFSLDFARAEAFVAFVEFVSRLVSDKSHGSASIHTSIHAR